MFLKKNGRVYFTKETERKFFFIMTIIMLFLGIMVQIGLF